ncbi:MAG: hypothetical protein ACYSO7_10710 [Planctomycetota bacterium]|jgi:hypothetical protein
MKREHLFIAASVIFCVATVALFAGEGAERDALRGILNLPDNVSVELISTEHGTLMLTEEDGQVELPQGQYRLESWTLENKDGAGYTWMLSGDVNRARMIEVGPEPTTPEIKTEPIVCDLKIYPGPQTMNFTLGLNGPAGERLRVSGDGPGVQSDQLPQPTFVLYNADRSFEKSHHFQSQCCGNYRFNWTPPAEAEGPFFVDLNVAGPFKIDFEPVNLSEAHQVKIAEQQALHKRNARRAYIIGLCYIAVLSVLIAALFIFRKSIAAAMLKSESKPLIKRAVLILGVFIILMMLNPLFTIYTGDHGFNEALAECGLFAGLVLIGAGLVWCVCKVRTKWPFVTIMLYGVFFVLLLIPVLFAAFLITGHPDTDVTDIDLDDFGEFYVGLFTIAEPAVLVGWAIILGILAAQASLLIVPVRIKHQRPKKRRGIWWTAIVAALLYTALLFMLAMSVMAVIWKDDPNMIFFWVVIGILPLNWIGWSVAFCLFSRSMEPESFIRRLMRWLIGGSILELLVAVPSHIIVRHRDVCCAHGLTAAGLTTGLAVIFFAFGPGLYFLYADRIRGKQPDLPEQTDPLTPDMPPQG